MSKRRQDSPSVGMGANTTWQPRFIGAVLIVAFALRIAFAAGEGLTRAPDPGSDQAEYDAYAWNLACGNGYRGMSPDVADQNHLTAYRPPVPSVLFAFVYLLAGHNYAAARVVNCLIGASSVWLVFRIGQRVFGASVAVLAALGYAVFPLAVLQSTDLLSEPAGVFLFLLFVDRVLVFAESPSWAGSAVAGIAFGLALLARANLLFMAPLVIVWSICQFRRSWQVASQALAIVGFAAITLMPWTIRNYALFGKFIPFSTMGGSALLQGNNRIVLSDPKLFGYSVWDTQIPEYREALQSADDEVLRDERAKQFAIEWLKENRDKWPILLWRKFVRSWTPFLTHNPSAAHRLIYLATWGPVLVLFCIGFFPTLAMMLKKGDPGWLLHLAVVHYVMNTLVFFANIRYRAPVDPICLLFAAWTMVGAWSLIRGRSASPITRTPAAA